MREWEHRAGSRELEERSALKLHTLASPLVPLELAAPSSRQPLPFESCSACKLQILLCAQMRTQSAQRHSPGRARPGSQSNGELCSPVLTMPEQQKQKQTQDWQEAHSAAVRSAACGAASRWPRGDRGCASTGTSRGTRPLCTRAAASGAPVRIAVYSILYCTLYRTRIHTLYTHVRQHLTTTPHMNISYQSVNECTRTYVLKVLPHREVVLERLAASHATVRLRALERHLQPPATATCALSLVLVLELNARRWTPDGCSRQWDGIMRRSRRHRVHGARGHWAQRRWSRTGRRRQRGWRRWHRRDESAFKVAGRRVGHVELRVRVGRMAIARGVVIVQIGNELL